MVFLLLRIEELRKVLPGSPYLPPAAIGRLRFSRKEAAALLAISVRLLDKRVKEGFLHPVFEGSHPRFTLDELLRYARQSH